MLIKKAVGPCAEKGVSLTERSEVPCPYIGKIPVNDLKAGITGSESKFRVRGV